MKAINLASVKRTKVRKIELQKARKAVKLRQTVGEAMTKQKWIICAEPVAEETGRKRSGRG